MRSAPLLLSLLPLFLACSSSSNSPAPPPCEGVAPADAQACLTEHYFKGYVAQSEAPCAGFTVTKKKFGGNRELTLFTGGTSDDVAVRREGQFLQRFYEPYDLLFFTRQAAAPSGVTYALNATNAQLADISRQVGLAPGAQPTAEQTKALNKATGDVIFADLRNFIRAQSNPPRKAINVVILDHIASPDVAAMFTGGVIAGLGLSPTLFKNIAADDSSKDLFDLIGLGEDFTPTLFVGDSDVTALAKSPDVIVSHELGHAMGLQHTKEQGNLMTQYSGSGTCLPGLTDQEIDVLKSTGGLLEQACGYNRLFELRDTVVRAILAQR